MDLLAMQSQFFWGPQILVNITMNHNKNFLNFWCCIYARLQGFFHLWKHLVMKVSLMLVPLCFVSILFTTCGRNDSCYGHQMCGYGCLTKTCKCNNYLFLLIYECSEVASIHLLWLSIISLKLGSLCMLLLGYLR
jgi:hypothetical protein